MSDGEKVVSLDSWRKRQGTKKTDGGSSAVSGPGAEVLPDGVTGLLESMLKSNPECASVRAVLNAAMCLPFAKRLENLHMTPHPVKIAEAEKVAEQYGDDELAHHLQATDKMLKGWPYFYQGVLNVAMRRVAAEFGIFDDM